MNTALVEIRSEANDLCEERDNLQEEIKEALELIVMNKKRLAEIDGRLDTLSDAASAAKSCDKYGLYIAGF